MYKFALLYNRTLLYLSACGKYPSEVTDADFPIVNYSADRADDIVIVCQELDTFTSVALFLQPDCNLVVYTNEGIVRLLLTL